MAVDLRGVELRLARAEKSLAVLHGLRDLYVYQYRDSLAGYLKAGSGECIFSVDQPPPMEWGITVSEFAHVTRTALDNLLACAVRAHGGRVGSRHQFPINEKKADFFRQPKGGGTPRGEFQTKGIADDESAFIKDLQPFQAGRHLSKWQPLALLARLNNRDKHRDIHVGVAAASVFATEGPYAGRPWLIAAEPLLRLGYLQPGRIPVQGFMAVLYINGRAQGSGYSFAGSDNPAEIIRFLNVPDIPPDAEVEMNPGPAIEVSFSSRERPVTIFDLIDIRTAVVEIVNWFRPRIT